MKLRKLTIFVAIELFSMLRILFLTLCFVLSVAAVAQRMYEWRSHLSHARGVALTQKDGQVIYASASGIVRPTDGVELTKVSGMRDAGITAFLYSARHELFFVGYSNGNIEVVPTSALQTKSASHSILIADIKDAENIVSKTINRFACTADRCVAATDFGIVEIDHTKGEIRTDFTIHPAGVLMAVRDLVAVRNYWAAATDTGIFFCPTNHPQWFYYENWHHAYSNNSFKQLVNYHDTLFALRNDGMLLKTYDFTNFDTMLNSVKTISIHSGNFWIAADTMAWNYADNRRISIGRLNPQDMMENGGALWIADSTTGLWHCTENGCLPQTQGGLPAQEVQVLAAHGGSVWAAGIGFVCKNENSKWVCDNSSPITTPVGLAINPMNTEYAWAADSTKIILYNYTNSKIVIVSTENINSITSESACHFTAVEAAANGELLAATTCQQQLLLRKMDGIWEFPVVSGIENSNIAALSHYGNVFRGITTARPTRLFAYQHSNHSESAYDVSLRNDYTTEPIYVSAITMDRNGETWLGTNKGAAAYAAGGTWSETQGRKVQTQSDMPGYAAYLLEYETITTISSDGGSRKWFGTAAAGALLQSADGTTTIRQFSAENSPLPSNYVKSIAVNDISGEVFFAANKGVVSFVADATQGMETFSDVKIYPNPVRPTMHTLTITGLVDDAELKIVDAAGRLVHSSTANGGTLVWDLQCALCGGRAGTGVYIVFMTASDGSQREVGKVLIVK